MSPSCTFSGLDADARAETRARDFLDRFEAEVSTRFSDSDLSEINRAAGGQAVEVGEHTARLLYLCKSQFEEDRTDGLFSPALYPLSELWGFAGEGEHRVPTAQEIGQVLPFCDFSQVSLEGNTVTKARAETALDLGGVAKGYALQRMREILVEEGATRGIVNLAGSLLVLGEKSEGEPYQIAIEDPRAAEHGKPYAAVLRLSDCYVSTSSDAENFFTVGETRYCHILDPRTGAPAETDLLSVTVVWQAGGTEEGGALSDLWSTAFYLMGMERARAYAEEKGISVFLLGRDGRYYTDLPLVSHEQVYEGYLPL